ncbi:MAG: metal-dependent hydrolase [Magnetococcales bacterium]|nr:metal-dependent hydrolase [Magnetococcales bacterium]
MADAKTHVTVAALVGGAASLALHLSGFLPPAETLWALLACLAGGVMPDLDADNSVVLREVFTLIAITVAFTVVFAVGSRFSVLEAMLLWLVVNQLTRLLLFRLVEKLTTHRGIWHSVPAALFSGFLTTGLLYRVAKQPDEVAWLVGFFVFLGFLVHLLLDEVWALPFFGPAKGSLGSALKLYVGGDLLATGGIYLLAGGTFFLTPEFASLWKLLGSASFWSRLGGAFWPHGAWFGLFGG